MLSYYLAARYGRKDEMRDYADTLKKLGLWVSSTWHDMPKADGDSNGYQANAATREIAERNLREIDYCDVLLAFTEEPGSPYGRGGRHVEMGYALGKSKAVRVIGPIENITHCLSAGRQVANQSPFPSMVQFDTFEEYIASLSQVLADDEVS